jgi:natural resistance-associated macrophage protein
MELPLFAVTRPVVAVSLHPHARVEKQPPSSWFGRAVGLGLITGAADDDPSAIGTYAAAGAKLGPGFLWTAPVTFPMMVAVVYLSSKLGQVTGKGLFEVIRDHYPPWLLRVALVGVIIGNTIEAGADIGGMAAAIDVLTPGVSTSGRGRPHHGRHSVAAGVRLAHVDSSRLQVARASHAAHHASHQRPGGHGRRSEWPRGERAGVDDHRRDIQRNRRIGVELVEIIEFPQK